MWTCWACLLFGFAAAQVRSQPLSFVDDLQHLRDEELQLIHADAYAQLQAENSSGLLAPDLKTGFPLRWADVTILAGQYKTGELCTLLPETPDSWLDALRDVNCKLVSKAKSQLTPFAHQYGNEAEWNERIRLATAFCEEAAGKEGTKQSRTEKAIQAWGNHIMEGRECCSVVGPPFCVVLSSHSRMGHFVPFLVSVVLITALGLSSVCKCCRNVGVRHTDGVDIPELREQLRSKSGSDPPAGEEGRTVTHEELMNYFDTLSLSDLTRREPHDTTRQWVSAAASLFLLLQKKFGFQADSVRNIFEHFLSMWKDEVCQYLDSLWDQRPQSDGTDPASTCRSMGEAIKFLNMELMDGYKKYIARMYGSSDNLRGWAMLSPVESEFPPLSTTDQKRSLCEVIAFMLVWGEAGNLRFMPEVLYFITSMVLTADLSVQDVYGDISQLASAADKRFLAKIVRPLYNYVFSTTYQKVTVSNGKDNKVMHPGFNRYMPADLCNYDDWNELFCDATRLQEQLVLKTSPGTTRPRFFQDGNAHFVNLGKVDWAASLKNCKTHREVHSSAGLFKAMHRIVLLHLLMFLITFVCISTLPPQDQLRNSDGLLLGEEFQVRMAAVGLLLPLHILRWQYCEWICTGAGMRNVVLPRVLWLISAFIPLATYGAVRASELGFLDGVALDTLCQVHYLLSGILAVAVLCFPHIGRTNPSGSLTSNSIWSLLVRWIFWIVVLGIKGYIGMLGLKSLDQALQQLNITRFGTQSLQDLQYYLFSPTWDKDMVVWAVMYSTGLLLYISDTQFWFSLGCSFLGVLVAFHQRSWELPQLWFGDKVARLYADAASGFPAQVFCYDRPQEARAKFRILWDRVIKWMRYEDKIDNIMASNLSFHHTANVGEHGFDYWTQILTKPLPSIQQADTRTPSMFEQSGVGDRFLTRSARIIHDANFPTNPEPCWRISALSRAVAFKLPRPYRVPFMPSLTVLVPHYGESILLEPKDLFDKKQWLQDNELARQGLRENHREVPLVSFLQFRYPDEFAAFANRMAVQKPVWHDASTRWDRVTDEQWPDLCEWASNRSQTLWRTVAGMTMYHQALQAHKELQGITESSMYQRWTPRESFQCLVSMQMYAYFNATQHRHTNTMFKKFEALKVAFIDKRDIPSSDCQEAAWDEVHPNQPRRYYSCLLERNPAIDDSDEPATSDARKPRLTVELPGFPILGDGKGDNQNHAIIYTRGTYNQCIDANQGAYFEQMLLLPCVLGEFRRRLDPNMDPQMNLSRKIVGFPEHITSDIGTIGDFAAGAETAFGTILQRSYAVLGGRMHYGHPDMMNKVFMIQQGGVSKATKTVNLSEDIFAGMDFTLRGEGRTIQHTEYFHVSKGRDLGFGTVLVFFAKLSSGTGEQVLTRQMARLGEFLGLAEFCCFYYAHGGFYLTQWCLSKCIPMLVYLWLLIVLDSAEENCDVMDPDPDQVASSKVMVSFLISQFSRVMLLFLAAGISPLIFELTLEGGFLMAMRKLIVTMLTFSPLHFVFQAKIIGSYISNEILYGGAEYMATGRGLPTERRCFIAFDGPKKGLYNDYAVTALHDGAKLFMSSLFVIIITGIPSTELFWWCVALALTIASWLFAPFIYNPYQYKSDQWACDLCDWLEYFSGSRFSCLEKHDPVQLKRKRSLQQQRVREQTGQGEASSPDDYKPSKSLQCDWNTWYLKTVLKPATGIRTAAGSILVWTVYMASWYTVLNSKVHIIKTVLTPAWGLLTQLLPLIPPVVLSYVACVWAVHANHDLTRSRPAAQEADASRASSAKWHKFQLALLIVLLDVGEGVGGLFCFIQFEWYKGLLAGVMLKYAWLSMLCLFAECFFRINRKAYSCSHGHKYNWKEKQDANSKCPACRDLGVQEGADIKDAEGCFFCKEPPMPGDLTDEGQAVVPGFRWHMEEALYLWLMSHRMAKDIFISGFIFFCLSFGVIFDKCRGGLCGVSYGIHNLLVYRDPGYQSNAASDAREMMGMDLVPAAAPALSSSGRPRLQPPVAGPSDVEHELQDRGTFSPPASGSGGGSAGRAAEAAARPSPAVAPVDPVADATLQPTSSAEVSASTPN